MARFARAQGVPATSSMTASKLVASLHPNETGHFTFWDYFRQSFEHNRGIRIDHFLLSRLFSVGYKLA